MLPKIDVPIYEVKLPLMKKTFRFRPFLVKEEKILLMAMEAEDEKTAIDAIKQIVNNCCLDDINVDSIPIVDLEFFFLNLRARSIGEVVELQYKCNNKVEDKECGNVVKFELNVLDIKPELAKDHTNKIEIAENLGVVMKYPTFKSIENVDTSGEKSQIEIIMNVIADSVDYIYDEDSIYYAKDVEKNELIEFLESLTNEQFKKIQEFFDSLPKIKKDLDFKCSKCNHEEKITVEGLQSFFV